MFVRSCAKALLFLGLSVPFIGCGSSTAIDSIQVSPTTVSLGTGNTAQLTAIGTIGHGSHPSTNQNITATVNWSSSIAAVATVSSTGMVTGVGGGTTTITATTGGFGGLITSNQATITVTGSSGGTGGATLASLAIIPGSQSVASPGQTSQFIAIGTTSSGATEDLTSQVAWSSSSASIATISASGLATGVGQGTTTITAIATNPGGTVVTGTATLTVVGGTTEQITSLTIYPGSQSATAQAQQSQFFVLGIEGSSGLPYDVSSQVVWTSSNEAVATIGTTGNGTPGLATAVGTGTTTITTTFSNTDGSKVVATAGYSVTTGAAQEPLLSINIVPGGITVSNKGMVGQFLAFGTYSTTPTVRDLTNQVTWISLLPEVASIESGGGAGQVGGVATAQGYTG